MENTRIISILIAAVIMIVICISGFKIRKKKGRLATLVRTILLISEVMIISNMVFCLAKNSMTALIAQTVYFIGIDILLLHVVEYVRYYTQEAFYSKYISILMHFFAGIDVIALLVNCYNNHMFDIGTKQMWGDNFFVYYQVGFMFSYHIMLTIVLICYIVVALAYKTAIVSQFHKKKYSRLLVLIVLLALSDITCMFFDSPIDFSLIFHSLVAMLISDFTFFYIPKGLVEKTLSLVVKDMDSAVVCYDTDGKCLYINEVGRKYFNLGKKEPLDSMSGFYNTWREEHKGKIKDNYCWTQVSGTGINLQVHEGHYNEVMDERGKIICYCFQISDVTSQTKAYNAEHYKATHDMLTGLYNREHFFEQVTEAVQNKDIKYSMILINIKDFKFINDIYGDNVGDKVLISVGNELKNNADEGTLYARMTGDKFVMCSPTDRVNLRMLEKACDKAEKCIDGTFKLKMQVGIYEIDDPEIAPDVMCGRAAIAMSQGKDERVAISYYDKKIMMKKLKDKQFIAEFESALEKGDFIVDIQPIVDLDGKIVGGEALARWNHPTYGTIMPQDFLDLFEQTRLICQMDEYVWNQTAQIINKLNQKGFDGFISVNVSSKDYFYRDMCETLTEIVQKNNIKPEQLRLEITEESFETNAYIIFDVIEKLKEKGFVILLDDFGSGYSSLNMLKDIAVDGIKLDITHMLKADDVSRVDAIMEMIFELTESLNIYVIAETVEKKEQYQYLKRFGCKYYQGYFVHKPVSKEEFYKLT